MTMASTRTLIGAGTGAGFGIVWTATSFGWALLVLALAVVGATIGFVFDRPNVLIDVLQRISER
jgi:hypothetical protein